jgi:hypothetical protein
MPNCNSCGASFPNWAELATHIIASKRGHQRGRVWASGLLLKTKQLNAKKELTQSTASPEQKLAIKETKEYLKEQGELSGDTEIKPCLCPSCKRTVSQELPTEYTSSPYSWKTGNGTLIVNCPSCLNLRRG